MKINWPKSVAEECIGEYSSSVTEHTRLHHTLLLLREDAKLRKHIQPISATYCKTSSYLYSSRLTFACTALGKVLLESAYLRSCENMKLTGGMVLSIDVLCLDDGTHKPQLVWEVYGLNPAMIKTKFDWITDGLNEILKEGI